MNLFSQHRDRADLPGGDFFYHFDRLRPIVNLLRQKDRHMEEWYLKGGNLSDALRFSVYGVDERPRKTAVDELIRRYKEKKSVDTKVVGIWNGEKSDDDGASLAFSIDGEGVLPRLLDFNLNERGEGVSRLGSYQSVAEIVAKVAEIYGSSYVTYGPRKYVSKKIFQDRPGVSWMLYLPRVLTVMDVPEARALISVMQDDGRQQGTIIVSVTDAVFDVNNQAHVKVANAIEIRLADQDMLPRFIDL